MSGLWNGLSRSGTFRTLTRTWESVKESLKESMSLSNELLADNESYGHARDNNVNLILKDLKTLPPVVTTDSNVITPDSECDDGFALDTAIPAPADDELDGG